MIRLLHHTPIKRKLTIITMFTVGLALALACVGFTVYDQVILRRDLVRDLSSTADMIGFNSASALSFNDPTSAEQTLKGLAALPQITGACVYSRDNAVFAVYHRGQVNAFPATPPQHGAVFDRDRLVLVRPIIFDSEVIGTVLLRSDLSELSDRLRLSGIIFAVVMLGAGLTAYGIVSRLQRVISEPISQLATVADRVALESNYSVRAVKQGNDEVGALIDGFNEMLAQIQARDQKLQQAHNQLEQRVEARTRELAEYVSLLNATLDSTTDGIVATNHAGEVVSYNSKFAAMWNLPADVLARRNADEMIGLAATMVRDGERFLQTTGRRYDADAAHSVDLIELIDGRTFERYVHPQRVDGRDVGVVISYRNITERRQAQEQAAREQARLKFIFDSVPVGICLDHVVPNGERNRVLNDAHLRICGLTRDEAVVGAFERITHPEDFKQQSVLRHQLECGLIGRFSLEKRYLRANGDTVWVTYSVQRQRYPDGSHQDLSTVVDITEVKQAQEEVARERARFKFIFDSVPVGISLVVPEQDNSHVVNPAHTRITGIPPEKLLEPGAFERATHPEDLVRQKDIVQRYKRGEIDQFSLEKRYVHPDGRTVWAALTRRMFIDPSTGARQSITTVIDISDLKAAEQEVARERARFKFIFEAVPVGISLVLPDQHDSHLVNPAHAQITGVSIEDSRLPGIFQSVSHPDDYARQREFVKKYCAGDIDTFTIEKRYLHPEGKVVWASMTSRWFPDPSTGRPQSITTLVDITERKEAEAKLAETHKQLLDTSRQAGMAEVATGVLHNVGNVLNSVNVSTTLLTDLVRQSKIANVVKLGELLAQQKDNLAGFFAADPRGQKIPGFVQTLSHHLTQEQRDLLGELESLRKNVEHIKEIVAMQQSYAKVSGVSETVSVTDLIEDALRMNAGAFARHDVRLVQDFQVNPSVTLEKHKVLQILINLMRNAKYACDDSGKSEKQIVLRVTSAGDRVRISVSDNGVGIPAENLTRIFSHGFTTRKHGHGFGLHSGALAAKELGGALIAQSDGPGLGATFTLELPLKQEAKAA